MQDARRQCVLLAFCFLPLASCLFGLTAAATVKRGNAPQARSRQDVLLSILRQMTARTESGVRPAALCEASCRHGVPSGRGFCRRGGMVDAADLGSVARSGRGGSSPLVGTLDCGFQISGCGLNHIAQTDPQSTICNPKSVGARGLVGRRLLCTEEIAGSNPAGSIEFRVLSSEFGVSGAHTERRTPNAERRTHSMRV